MHASAAANKGDPLYAELEYKKRKQNITPLDMTGVQYREIKCVDMILHYDNYL